MFCINCGAHVADDVKFCPKCGSAMLVSGEPEALTSERVTEDTVITNIPYDTAPKKKNPMDNGRDIYSSAPHRFRPEPEMEDISSGEPIPVQRIEYREPERTPAPQQVQYAVDYEDGYEYEEYDERAAAPKKKRAWIWVVVVVVILAAVIGTAVSVYSWYTAPIRQFSRALEADDYAQITRLLPQLEDSEREALAGQMKQYAAEAVERYNKGEVEYGAAYDLVDRLQRLFPDATELKSLAEEMKLLKTSKESFAAAQSAEQTGDVSGALRLFGEVVQSDTNYETAQAHIEAIKADYKSSVLKQAQALADEEDFAGAQELLTASYAILGDDPDIAAKVEELLNAEQESYVASMLEIAQGMADEGDLIGAVRFLENVTREDPSFTQQIDKYKETYKNEKLEEAKAHADAAAYEEAVAVLEDAKEFLGEDDKLNAKIEEYKALYPVLLVNLQPTGGSNCNSLWPATGVYGEQYTNGLSFALYPEVFEMVQTEYTPGGKYKRFSGTWVVESNTTEGFIGKIRVYVDGSLQYELSSLTLNSTAKEMNLLISGAETIRIEAEGAFADPRQLGYIYLADATFKN